MAFEHMADYDKALSCFEKYIEISEEEIKQVKHKGVLTLYTSEYAGIIKQTWSCKLVPISPYDWGETIKSFLIQK